MQNPIFHAPCVEGDGRPVFPMECIEQNRTYRSELSVDLCVKDLVEDLDRVHTGVSLGLIPVMVGSDYCNLIRRKIDERAKYALRECPYDEGGYFIIKGTSKVLICQDRPMSCYNRVYVFKKRKSPAYDYFAEVRSVSGGRSGRSTTVVIGLPKEKNRGRAKPALSAVIPYMSDKTPIPLGALFKALGTKDEREIVSLIFPEPDNPPSEEDLVLLTPTLEQAYQFGTREMALEYIGRMARRFFGENTDTGENNTALKKIDHAKRTMETQLFLHIRRDTPEETEGQKRLFLGYMTKRLLDVILGRDVPDDKDHYATKRATTPGILLERQFSRDFRRLCSDLIKAGELAIERKNTIDVKTWVKNKSTNITTSLNYCISMGMFAGKMIGVSQNYDRFNFVASYANARKVSTPINESGKVIGPRQLHSSHWGVCCPYATPEGKKAGLLKDLALTCRLSVGNHAAGMKERLRLDPLVRSLLSPEGATAKVFVNSDWYGWTGNGQHLARQYRIQRRAGGLNPVLGIAFNQRRNEVRFSTDAGRFYRPLFIVENGKLLYSERHARLVADQGWDYLLQAGVVEYIDKEEEEEMVVKYRPSDVANLSAADQKHVTHCELHASMILSASATVVPFPDRNQAPRNSYAAQMSKQSIGVPSLNFLYRVKGTFNVLDYPQCPVVESKASQAVGLNVLPAGENIILAVCAFRGYNQEDSLVFNQASIDRGLFNISRYLTYYAEVKKTINEEFAIPVLAHKSSGILIGRGASVENFRREEEKTTSSSVPLSSPNTRPCLKLTGSVAKLDLRSCHVLTRSQISERRSRGDPLATSDTVVCKGDILVGRVVKNLSRGDSILSYRDASLVYRETFPGRVHRAEHGINASGYEFIRVIVVQVRPAAIGDKFAALHAQKGTIGKIVPSTDLPFTREGISPDALINPLAFPSRMTIAMFMECLVGKKVCLSPRVQQVSAQKYFLGDGTPFEKVDVEEIERSLVTCGFEPRGKEHMIDGITGRSLPSHVLIGPVYYQRLKHMVIDKIHARARGSHTSITRQPKEGRQFGGGFRVGYMERDNLAGQGAAAFLIDRLLENSDEYSMWFCALCGVQAVMLRSGQGECSLCKSRDVRQVRLPYATKLLMQELQGMGVLMRVLTSTFDDAKPRIEPLRLNDRS